MKPLPSLALFAILALVVLITAPLIGMEWIPLSNVIDSTHNSVDYNIFWRIRVPRVLTAFLAGSALAVSGMVFQAMFRNALATPFTLGVASGASLGAALSVTFGLTASFAGISATTVMAFLGANISIALVYGLTHMRRGFSTATMLLSGVAISFFFSSVILFLQYSAELYNSFRMLRWVMGGLGLVGYDSLLSIIPFVVTGVVMLLYTTHELNLLVLGDDIAISRGVDVLKTKRLLFFVTSLMVGSVVAVCGPIGFIGMMVPHMCRLMGGNDHRYLIPACLLFGGTFLTLCDTFARTALAPAELPVGVVTAFLGGPFFVMLLLRGKEGTS
ncbi:MAG: iron ABC transporter permease [Candidatus Hydrogenedentota bacterium]